MISKLTNGQYGLIITFLVFGIIPYALLYLLINSIEPTNGLILPIRMLTFLWLYIVFMSIRATINRNSIIAIAAAICIGLLCVYEIFEIYLKVFNK